MDAAPLVSIVTINLNDAAGLYATLRSGERLTYPALEQIVVDGGSDDGSAEIARDFGHWIDSLIAGPDGGVYAAMNKGVQAARGDWIIFMNAGDCFDAPDVLDSLPLTGPADIVHGRARALGAGHVRDYADALWKGMAFCHQASLTRRERLEQFPFDEARPIISDWEFFVRCACGGARFEAVEAIIAAVDDTGRSYGAPAELAARRLPVARAYYGGSVSELEDYYRGLMEDGGEAASGAPERGAS